MLSGESNESTIDMGIFEGCEDWEDELSQDVNLNKEDLPTSFDKKNTNEIKLEISKTPFDISKNLLRIYYDKYFPGELLYNWLSYGDPNYTSNREFSFTLQNDIYIRYLSFDTPQSFKSKLLKDIPIKIDIGPVFNSRPSERKIIQTEFKPVERELVFDIDMTDYNDVRTCCQDKNVCCKCWKFIAVAVKIIDISMRDDFGFKDILWIFSGRRGIHCWISDLRSRKLNNLSRKSLVGFLEIFKKTSDNRRKIGNILPSPIPENIWPILNIVDKYFKDIINDQDILNSPASRAKIIQFINNEDYRKKINEMWSSEYVISSASSIDYWEMLKSFMDENASYEIQLQLIYPRLDAMVSVHLNHLLKAPFCVHPSTGKICIPVDPEFIDQFDPSNVPTIFDLDKNSTEFDSKVNIFKKFIEKTQSMC